MTSGHSESVSPKWHILCTFHFTYCIYSLTFSKRFQFLLTYNKNTLHISTLVVFSNCNTILTDEIMYQICSYFERNIFLSFFFLSFFERGNPGSFSFVRGIRSGVSWCNNNHNWAPFHSTRHISVMYVCTIWHVLSAFCVHEYQVDFLLPRFKQWKNLSRRYTNNENVYKVTHVVKWMTTCPDRISSIKKGFFFKGSHNFFAL